MNDYEQKAWDFHAACDGNMNRPLSPELLALRKTLLAEEMKELFDEMDLAASELKGDGIKAETLTNLLKEMADVQYVLSGLAVTFGLPMQEVIDRVHASNMSKMGENGKAMLREDGKILKGPRYRPPELRDLAEAVLDQWKTAK